MNIAAEAFSKAVIAALPADERTTRLPMLEAELNRRLADCRELSRYQERLYALIKQLESLGFSLGPWEYNCEVESWGGPSYMNAGLEDDLLLRSRFPFGVVLAWKDFEQLKNRA